MPEPRLGFIGGSGLYEIESLTDRREIEVSTPFGYPSDKIVQGSLNGAPVAFLPRHGRGHRITPTEIPARANIYALKSLGVQMLVSVSAVGSLKEEIAPLDLVIPDQIIDRTRLRGSPPFFGDGLVAHVGFADPFCPVLRKGRAGGRAGRPERPRRRDVRCDGRSAVLDESGVGAVPLLGGVGHRHDRAAGGQAGAGGGDVLPDAGVRDGLRRLARD